MIIETEHEYIRALWRLGQLMELNPEACTDEYVEMDELADAVVAYEDEHYNWEEK